MEIVPRSFHLSYLLHRAAGQIPGGDLIARGAQVVDPKVPVGWIGDVTLVIGASVRVNSMTWSRPPARGPDATSRRTASRPSSQLAYGTST